MLSKAQARAQVRLMEALDVATSAPVLPVVELVESARSTPSSAAELTEYRKLVRHVKACYGRPGLQKYREARRQAQIQLRREQRENLTAIRPTDYIPHERYLVANMEAMRRTNRARRARLHGVAHIPYDKLEIFKRDQGICWICGKPIDCEPWHLDHFYPISKGGPDIPENVRVAHAGCNREKHDRLPTHSEAQAWLTTIAQ